MRMLVSGLETSPVQGPCCDLHMHSAGAEGERERERESEIMVWLSSAVQGALPPRSSTFPFRIYIIYIYIYIHIYVYLSLYIYREFNVLYIMYT